MNAIADWVRGLVALTVFAGAVDMMLPAGDLRKYARVALGLLIVLKVASPLSGLGRGGEAGAGAAAGVLDAFRGTDREAVTGYDEKTRRLIEWQCERLVTAIPGVESASVSARFRQPDDWPMPLGAAAVERLDIKVRVASDRGRSAKVRAVRPVGRVTPGGSGAAEDPGPAAGGDELLDAIRAAVCEKFGLTEDAVHVEESS